jgi:hypothetical protein
MSAMKRGEVLAGIGAVLLVILLLVGVAEGLWSVTSILEYGPYFIILGIIALLGWGFRARLESLGQRLSQKGRSITEQERPKTFAEIVDEIKQERIRSSLEGAEPVDRMYDTVTLKFKIRSNSDWIEVGLKDSQHITVKDHNVSKGKITWTEDPDNSYFHIDRPDAKVSVTATFVVYSGPLFVFVRKSDSTKKFNIRVFDRSGKFLHECEYFGTSQKQNYKDFGFEFSNWD